MPADPIIRAAVAEDLVAVVGVWWRSRAASIGSIPSPIHSRHEVSEWLGSKLVAAPECPADLDAPEVWVAVSVGGEVAAMLVLEADVIDQLYVEPAWTGRGIGSGLIGWAKQRRPGGLQLWTFQANHGALRFYDRHGFFAVHETDGDNEEGAPDVRLHWSPPD